jgi:hypothetical protein
MDAARILGACRTKFVEEKAAICIGTEYFLPIVATQDDVLLLSGERMRKTWQAGHGVRIWRERCLCLIPPG